MDLFGRSGKVAQAWRSSGWPAASYVARTMSDASWCVGSDMSSCTTGDLDESAGVGAEDIAKDASHDITSREGCRQLVLMAGRLMDGALVVAGPPCSSCAASGKLHDAFLLHAACNLDLSAQACTFG